MMAADEQQLVLQAKEGSHEAYRLIVERYMKKAYNIAYGFVNNHDDAEDVAQESFVRIYQSIFSFRGEACFSTWLYRIVMNLSLNRLRQKKSVTNLSPRMIDSMANQTEQSAVDDCHYDVRTILERELHELPTLQRAVVILRHLNGLTTRQVSSILQCSEGTVKTHLYRGLKKMRLKLNVMKNEVL